MRITVGRGSKRRFVDIATGPQAPREQLRKNTAELTTVLLNMGIIARSAA